MPPHTHLLRAQVCADFVLACAQLVDSVLASSLIVAMEIKYGYQWTSTPLRAQACADFVLACAQLVDSVLAQRLDLCFGKHIMVVAVCWWVRCRILHMLPA